MDNKRHPSPEPEDVPEILELSFQAPREEASMLSSCPEEDSPTPDTPNPSEPVTEPPVSEEEAEPPVKGIDSILLLSGDRQRYPFLDKLSEEAAERSPQEETTPIYPLSIPEYHVPEDSISEPALSEGHLPTGEKDLPMPVSLEETVPVVEEASPEPVSPETTLPVVEEASPAPVSSETTLPVVEEALPEPVSLEETVPTVEDIPPEPVVSAAEEGSPGESLVSAPEEATLEEPIPEEPDMFAELPPPPSEPEKAPPERVTRKGRPKRKKGEGLLGLPNILVTAVWMALIVVIGVTLGRLMWVCAADVLAFGRPDQKVTITVYNSDTMDTIIDKLHSAGLIRYKGLFRFYADISDAEEDIKPGIYDLNTRYDYHALVKSMAPSSSRSVVEVTIPEGYTCRQIFALLEENRVCTAVDIAAYAASGELHDYWFLENVERGSKYCLEGFLFPDTYQFYKNSSPREALEKMLNNFENRFNEEMRAQIDRLNANVTGGGYGVREVVIVASLIEKESASASESPTIASVIYNRLHNWEYPALLNIDAAIVYAQEGDARTIDTSIDSPYNTYRYTGLTPTPIANPGLASLKAALNPESTNYYYYVLNPATGKHQFSTTQAEHDSWIAKFYGNAG